MQAGAADGARARTPQRQGHRFVNAASRLVERHKALDLVADERIVDDGRDGGVAVLQHAGGIAEGHRPEEPGDRHPIVGAGNPRHDRIAGLGVTE
jgi:hypothetical protein